MKIKLFEKYKLSKLEEEVNEFLEACYDEPKDVKFSTFINQHQMNVYSCMVIYDGE